MKKIITASILAGALFAAGSAAAMPLAPLSPATADIIEVAGGCGQGWHRGPNRGRSMPFVWPTSPQLRPAVAASLPARLVSRPLRPLPRQRHLIVENATRLSIT